MKRFCCALCAFLFPFLALWAQLAPLAWHTYVGKLSNPSLSLPEVEREIYLQGARIAVRIGDLLILKSMRPLSSPLLHLELFEPGEVLEWRGAEQDLLNQLLQWNEHPEAEAIFQKELSAQDCGESCGCIPETKQGLWETPAGGLSLLQNPDNKRVLMCNRNPWELCDTIAWMSVRQQAIFEVAYARPDGAFGPYTRYQGSVNFHWGEGMRIRLRAPAETYSGGVIWDTPDWSAAGNSSVITFQKNRETPPVIFLQYRSSGQEAPVSYQYLHVGNALASPDVYAIVPNGNRLGFAGTRGISVWDGSTRRILDAPTSPGAASVPYDSRAGAAGASGDLFFSTLSGDITAWQGNAQTFYAPGTAVSFRLIARTPDGSIWAGVGADARTTQGEIAPSGLSFFRGGRYQVLRTNNSNIPSNYVSGLASMPSGKLLVSFLGPTDAESGLYVYDVSLQTWTDLSDQWPNRRITKLSAYSAGAIAQYSTGYAIIIAESVTHVQPALPPGAIVLDFTRDHQGNMYYATTLGVYVLDERGVLVDTYTMSNSMIPANTIFSIALTETGGLVLGTLTGAVLIERKQTVVTAVRQVAASNQGILHISPNPATEYLDLWLDRLPPAWNIHAPANILVFNSQGACIQRIQVPVGAIHHRVNIAHLPAGVYWVKAGGAVGKFIVSR